MKVKRFTSLTLAAILIIFFFSCELTTTGTTGTTGSRANEPVKSYSFKAVTATDSNGSGTIIRDNTTDDGTMATYVRGTTITVEASADSNCFFFGWYDESSDGDLISRKLKYSFILNEDTELYARFDKNDISFNDPALEEAVRLNLGNLTGKLTIEQVKQITKLDANSNTTTAKVSDLSGIEYLTNLRRINLTMANISDLSPLSEMSSLRILYLSGNKITDISPLAGLTDIYALMLNFNEIEDISIVKNMPGLLYLTVGDNKITDFTPIAGLTNLTYLQIFSSNISDISFLSNLTKLTSLEATYNSITDISVLIDMAKRGFKGTVYLNGNDLKLTQVDELRKTEVTVEYTVKN